jgi:AcrR family transcriptional regulator
MSTHGDNDPYAVRAMPPKRATRRRREPLSRERIIRVAVEVADRDGMDAATMRRLGQELGVEAMSLYNHVGKKSDILDGALEVVVGEFPMPAAAADWRAAIRTSAVGTFEVLLRHRWACNVLLSRTGGTGPARQRYGDWLLGTLRRAGFSVELTHHAFHVLENYINGTAAAAANFPIPFADLPALAARFRDQLDADAYPHLVEHIAYHADAAVVGKGDFEFGLDLILDSLERLRVDA